MVALMADVPLGSGPKCALLPEFRNEPGKTESAFLAGLVGRLEEDDLSGPIGADFFLLDRKQICLRHLGIEQDHLACAGGRTNLQHVMVWLSSGMGFMEKASLKVAAKERAGLLCKAARP